MSFTVNKYYNTPSTGSYSGAWGTTVVNTNMASLDGVLGGFSTIALSSATTIALSVPAGAATGLTPGAGPTQSENALIKFTGTLTGTAVIQFTMPGFYIVHNLCGSATVYPIKLSPVSGGGNSIAAPPGRKAHIFYDGTDVDYVDMPEVGSALDLHGVATTPVWMQACSVRPYLVKDGSIYNASAYTALAALLGSTYGGNGVSTFGVPDERARARIALDTLSVATGTYAGRLTAAGSGVNGTTLGAAGGSEFLQTHTHTVTDPGHVHAIHGSSQNIINNVSVTAPQASGWTSSGGTLFGYTDSTTAGISATNSTGSGSSQNVMPVIVSFLPLIKT